MRPLFEGIRLVGTAVTVKTLAADLAAAFKAIDVSRPGDIVVIDSHGSVDTAFCVHDHVGAQSRCGCRSN